MAGGVAPKMNNTLYLLRAMRPDPVALHLADALSRAAGHRVVFVCDESSGQADLAPYDKVSMTPRILQRLGFAPLAADWGWFWGDMCYQAAVAQFPGFDAYCLMESDVFLSCAGAGDLMARLAGCDAQAVAGRLRRYAEPQKYSRALSRLGLDPHWGCIFPVSRVTPAVVAEMAELRREAIGRMPRARLNDEAILAGAVQRGGFTHAALEDVAPAQVSPAQFETNPPHLFETLRDRPQELRLFHPVVTLETVLARIAGGQKGYGRHRMRKVLRMASAGDRARIEAALDGAITAG